MKVYRLWTLSLKIFDNTPPFEIKRIKNYHADIHLIIDAISNTTRRTRILRNNVIVQGSNIISKFIGLAVNSSQVQKYSDACTSHNAYDVFLSYSVSILAFIYVYRVIFLIFLSILHNIINIIISRYNILYRWRNQLLYIKTPFFLFYPNINSCPAGFSKIYYTSKIKYYTGTLKNPLECYSSFLRSWWSKHSELKLQSNNIAIYIYVILFSHHHGRFLRFFQPLL